MKDIKVILLLIAVCIVVLIGNNVEAISELIDESFTSQLEEMMKGETFESISEWNDTTSTTESQSNDW